MDFSLPAGNSRRRRRLKKPGAPAPGFRGLGAAATNKRAPGIYRGIACRYLRADMCKKISITIIFTKNL